MSNEFLLYVANIGGIRVGNDRASQIKLLNNTNFFENARVIEMGSGVTHTKEVQ